MTRITSDLATNILTVNTTQTQLINEVLLRLICSLLIFISSRVHFTMRIASPVANSQIMIFKVACDFILMDIRLLDNIKCRTKNIREFANICKHVQNLPTCLLKKYYFEGNKAPAGTPLAAAHL